MPSHDCQFAVKAALHTLAAATLWCLLTCLFVPNPAFDLAERMRWLHHLFEV